MIVSRGVWHEDVSRLAVGHKALLAIDLRSGCYAGVARFLRVAEEVADPVMVLVDRWPRFGLGTASR